MVFLCCSFVENLERMLEKDICDNKSIGDYGCKEILRQYPSNTMVKVLTHCNTGSLATAGYGTALGVVRSLYQLNRLGKPELQNNTVIYVPSL